MKTLIIYNKLLYNTLIQKFAIIDGDYSNLNGSYNSEDKDVVDFLLDESGNIKINFTLDSSLIENKEWDKIAIITHHY